jgi:hypothetical protein
MSMFDFSNQQGNGQLFLNPTTGEPISSSDWASRFSKNG